MSMHDTMAAARAGLPSAGHSVPTLASLRAIAMSRRPPAQGALPRAGVDREFLPAALEILETPPSPVALWMLVFICAACIAALAWSYFGWIDIHAVAQGKIQPSGHSKVVQPLEPGRIIAIRVENGARVRAGDVLVELDPTETSADTEAEARDLEASEAEAVRRAAGIAAARQNNGAIPKIRFAPVIGDQIQQREQNVLAAELSQLASLQANLGSQLAEKQATRQRLQLSIEARKKLIALASERVEMRTEMSSKGAGSRALIIESLQQLETQKTADAADLGQLLETDAAVQSLQRKLEEVVTQFIADQTQKQAEAERRRDRLAQELIKARSKRDRTRLSAPISGTVQQLSVTTVGQVVSSGQSLMTIVPLAGPIEIEALIANKDIGFVETDQPVVVKIEAFPFTRYGTIDGRVAKVSRDAVDERDAGSLGDPLARPQSGSVAAPGRPQNLVFPATIWLARRSIDIDGKEVPLMPGMAVTVEIRTGRRRAIDYLLAPLREVAGSAVHER